MKYSFYYSFLLSILVLIPCSAIFANERDNIREKGFQRAIVKFKKEPKVAVVVGINTYHPNSGLQSLEYAVGDANRLANILKNKGYTVRPPLINRNAVRSHILGAIQAAGSIIRRNQGTLIFFYSGHGFSYGKRNFLASFGTVSNNFAKTALSLDDVIIAIKKTGVRRAVLFIDACRDKPMMKGGKSIANPSFIYKKSEGIKILYSTKFGGVSYESNKLQGGVYSNFLIKALSGENADHNGEITFNTVKRYVEKEVPKWAFEHDIPVQTPFAAGESHGVFILGNRGRGQKTPNPRKIVRQTPERGSNKRHSPSPQVNKPRVYANYRDNGNGTITDTRNKLMWKKCSEGQKGNTCSGKAVSYTWDNAMRTFNNASFARYGNWRLPTKSELKTLVFCSNGVNQNIAVRNSCKNRQNPRNRYQIPTINQQSFPNTEGSPLSSLVPYAHSSANVWGISFRSGQEIKTKRGDGMHVRLVRRFN